MKSERRHALQTNTLSQFLDDLPGFFKTHANKIMTGLIVLALLIFLFNYRKSSADQHAQALRESLASIRAGLTQLATIEESSATPAQIATSRKDLMGQINGAVDSIIQGADEDQESLRAEAYVARGDMYWTLANAVPLPGAATQPSLRLPESSDALLDKAKASYEQVVQSYSKVPASRAAALFGLAAVAENRRTFDEAEKIYKSIEDAADIPDVYKTVARVKSVMLAESKEPVFVGPMNVETTQPSTQPDMGEPMTTHPATAPATMP